MTRRHKLLFFLLLLVIVPLAVLGGRFYLFLRTPIAPPASVQVTVATATSIGQTATRLAAAGVIADAEQFRLLARLRGADSGIRSGVYEFNLPATPERILARLQAGDVIRRRLTIPEGFTFREIAQRIETAGFGSAAEVLALLRDPDLLGRLDFSAPSLEGFLFPDTYFFAVETRPRQVLQVMLKEFRRRLTPELIEAGRRQGLSPLQLVTLASIVQKEAGRNDEMPLIASVYHNRLKRRMPLQADPTVIYGIPDFDGNLTRRHLQTWSPYNTYRIAGLPPGPIASPGAAALHAAAFPATSRYLYFVARGDGSHAFSATLSEHNDNVRRYQLRRRS